MSHWIERIWFPAKEVSFAREALLSPLLVAEAAFRAGVASRNARFDRGGLRIERVEGLRVISIGNLTVGGTGKTPAVIALASRFVAAGKRVAVLSRGYGRTSKQSLSFDGSSLPGVEEAGDEPLLIAARCPGVTVWVGADRVALAHRAQEAGAQIAILDDGFQHRRLARDVDIVVVDASSAFGNGHLLPRGPLREPLSSLSRASLLWVRESESGAPPFWQPPSVLPLVRARYRPGTLLSPDGAANPLGLLEGRKVVALAAIARPERFQRTLEHCGAHVESAFFLRDHRTFSAAQLAQAEQAALRCDGWLVTTEKDRPRLPSSFPAHVLALEVEFLEGEDHLQALVDTP